MNFTIHTENDKGKVVDYVMKLPIGKRFAVNIVLMRDKRTIDQNCLYWLWLTCIGDETGNDKEDLHEFFKGRFIGVIETNVFGRIIQKTVSSTTLDTKQFTIYLEKIRAFAATELGIVLPDPEDKYWQDFYDKYKHFI